MKNIFMLCMALVIGSVLITSSSAQDKNSRKDYVRNEKKEMKRFMVERTFPDGFKLAMNDEGKAVCQNVVLTNAEDDVTWVHSYFSGDGKKSFCIYDAPSAEAIRTAAKKNNLPVGQVTEVRVLDPYFFK